MKSRLSFLFASVCVFLFAGAPAASLATSPPVPPLPAGPRLSVGDTWTYDSGLKITFLQVLADTRKMTVAGREKGNAVIQLRLEAGNQAPKTVRLRTRLGRDYVVIAENEFPEGVVGIPKSYVIRIASITPDPGRRGGVRPLRAYAVRLAVEVAL
jgi:hypothetical protein